MTGIQQKVAVITGASNGIGNAIARELSAAGANLVLTARSSTRLNDVLQTMSGEAEIVPARIEAPQTASLLLDRACARFGRADILVNNAGCSRWDRLTRSISIRCPG